MIIFFSFVTCYLFLAELSCILPKKNKKKSKPSAKAYKNVLSMQFMRFANFLGFATPLIPREGVEGLMIQKLLLEFRTPRNLRHRAVTAAKYSKVYI